VSTVEKKCNRGLRKKTGDMVGGKNVGKSRVVPIFLAPVPDFLGRKSGYQVGFQGLQNL
jgi:hypothetical protein